jgi:DNA-directed RNA polymerase specialized sigma24 family protein
MHALSQFPLRFEVLSGHTYREPSDAFNRCLMPVYQTAYRWTGNRSDAEDVTTWVVRHALQDLDLPRAVAAVDQALIEATADAIGRHWSERYGISPLRWSAFHSPEVAAPWRSTLSLRALLDALPGEMRLVIVLRFLRRRSLGQVGAQLGLTSQAAAIVMFRALTLIAIELGFGQAGEDTVQAPLLANFVDHVVARRQPCRFEATPATFNALLAATHVHACIAGNDLPQARFVRSLEVGL